LIPIGNVKERMLDEVDGGVRNPFPIVRFDGNNEEVGSRM